MTSTPVRSGRTSAFDDTGPRRQWLEWAAAQIEATLAADGESTARVLDAVGALCSGVADAGRPAALAAPAAELVAAIQSHDRLLQQLQHVAHALRALGSLEGEGGYPPPSPAAWSALRRQQLRAFSMREERALFRSMVPDLLGDDAGVAEHHEVSAVDLF
jgi:hypothetical protein